jgi:NAD(P)-dependent dehydrogenase (short-subunit alcohol dehydrogenase family)
MEVVGMKNRERIVAVVDGQGGGIGCALVEALRRELPEVHIRALGTNSEATRAMLRAGAWDGATGENAIVFNAPKADIILGVFAIVMPNGLLGELTPAMAEAITASEAQKILLPMNRCNISIVTGEDLPIPKAVERAAALTKEAVNDWTRPGE